jgi:hypothetical protein
MSENMEMMGGIARAISNDSALSKIDWVELSIVFSFEEDGFCSGHFGYAYDPAGVPLAFTLDSMDAEAAASNYREWLRQKDDKGVMKMLFQFNRVTRKVNAEFDYDDASRWRVTPKNIDTITLELRPDLGS